jgi:hypothetical protein
MDAITADNDGDVQMIDSTSVRAHQQAATAKRGIEIIAAVDHAVGLRPRSMRSLTRKGSRTGLASRQVRRTTDTSSKRCSTIYARGTSDQRN